jgi:signal transduction histidine kinase
VIGRTPWDLGIWATGDAFRDVRARLAAHGTVQNLEAELRTKSGGTIWALFSATRMVVRGVPAVVSFTQDISDLKRTQRALREALERAEQSDRLKTAFLENMSHEFRTPLNVILGYNSLIAERLAESGDRDAEDLVDAVSRASKRLIRSLHSVLELARFQTRSFAVHPAAVDVARVADGAVCESRPLAERKGIALALSIETERTSVIHDEACLASAVGHLVDNAIKFTDRGEIALRLSRDADDRLVLEVRDTGIGIDAGYLPKVFEPFSQESSGRTRAFEGLGIGLALVRRYLDSNGATIAVESEKGRGTTFTIRFAGDA